MGDSLCAVCDKAFSGGIIVTCVGCARFFHANANGVNCAGISSTEERAHALKSVKLTVYLCKSCKEKGYGGPMLSLLEELRSNLQKNNAALDSIKQCQSSIKGLEKDVGNLKTDVASIKHNTSEKEMSHTREHWLQEMRDRQRREHNIMVFNLLDTNNLKADVEAINKFLPVEDYPHSSFKLRRFGKFEQNANAPRALRVTFKSPAIAIKALQTFKKNNDSTATGIIVSTDKTKVQTAYYKSISDEVDERNGRGEKLTIKFVDGIPSIAPAVEKPKN